MGYEVGDYVLVKVRTDGSEHRYGHGKIHAKHDPLNAFAMSVILDDGYIYDFGFIGANCVLHKITDKIHIVELKLRGL